MPEPSDHELVARMNKGDMSAFDALYPRHRDWIFRMACRISGSEQQAQDVLQEVFRYFLGKFPGFELRCELRTFLYPAVRNLSIASQRANHRYVGGETGAATLDQLASPSNGSATHHDLHQIIAKLSDDHREILLLRFVDGMTLPEISSLTGIPLGTAKSRLHHALATLRSDPKVQNLGKPVND